VPGRELVGVLLTVDLEKRDGELKLLLGCTAEEAEVILEAHNDGSQAATLLLRPAASWGRPVSTDADPSCAIGPVGRGAGRPRETRAPQAPTLLSPTSIVAPVQSCARG